MAFEVARIRARGADVHDLGDFRQPRRFHQVGAHHEVAVIELRRLALIDADAAVIRGRVNQHITRVFEQAPHARVERRQVVIALTRHEHVRTVAFVAA